MEKAPTPEKELNLYETSLEKKVLRHEAPDIMAKSAKKRLYEIKKNLKGLIVKEGGISGVKERLKQKKEETLANESWVDESAIEQEVSDYQNIKTLFRGIDELEYFKIRQWLNLRRDPRLVKVHKNLLDQAWEEQDKAKEQLGRLKTENPKAVRAAELVKFSLDLHEEGHIVETETVRSDLGQIGERMLVAKPMFLHGSTGTGKTSLARLAAKRFTGQNARMVFCNPQTRESNVWGKTGLRPAEGEAGAHGAMVTVDIYGPLARAISEGRTIIFDEFNALPKEQMVFIKGIFNKKPGDPVDVPGFGETKMLPGFHMIFTANLKSDKNVERQELPPEIAREFEQNNLKINYLPSHEAFDVVLARLMQKDGSVNMSWHDMNETIPNFLNAMDDIQTAYTGMLGSNTARLIQRMDTNGLKKLVLTQGTVEAILEAWQIRSAEKEHLSFTEFLDQRLKTTLTFEEYPLADRVLAAQILAMRGLLRTVTPAELNLPNDVFNIDAAKKLRENKKAVQKLISDSSNETRISLAELVDLDPFNRRTAKTKDVAAEFGVSSEPEKDALVPDRKKINQIFRGFLKNSYKESWGGSAEVVARAGELPEIMRLQDIDWENTIQVDASKFGEYTLNPDTIGIDWKNIPKEKIKVLDFSQFVGKPRWKLAKYITTEWPDRDKYHIPGIEYWKYVFENPDKAPDLLKDGNHHYFFGSIFRGADGSACVPLVRWGGSRFRRGGGWLGNSWRVDDRVVFLEK